MPTKEHDKQHDKQLASRDNQERQHLNAVIGDHVMHGLGHPADLLRVQVRHLWEGRYRVNILAGVDVASVKVVHSYFVVADGDGNIVESSPKIMKQY